MNSTITHTEAICAKPTKTEIIEKIELDVAQLHMELARSKEQLCGEIINLHTERETLQK